MVYNLDILNEAQVDKDTLAALETAVIVSLSYFSSPPTSLSLLLTDDKRLQELNRDFRQIDRATDVLSFPANELLPEKNEPGLYLGDIAISVSYAAKQARLSDHSLTAELQLLTVHGMLHLLGYDHLEQEDRDEMWLLQENILSKLDLQGIVPTET